MTATAAPVTTYPEYAQPLWRRLLFTRESAIIGLLVAVVLYSMANVDNFDGPLTLTYLLLDTDAHPAHRAADDAGHHHR